MHSLTLKLPLVCAPRLIVDNAGVHAESFQVLRMLSNYVGEDRFLKGVSIYLKKKLYANSVTTDLWQGISESTGRHRIFLFRHHELRTTRA